MANPQGWKADQQLLGAGDRREMGSDGLMRSPFGVMKFCNYIVTAVGHRKCTKKPLTCIPWLKRHFAIIYKTNKQKNKNQHNPRSLPQTKTCRGESGYLYL